MASVTVTRDIQAPRDLVFHHATNLRSAAERISGISKMEVLTDGPVRKGTRFRETRIMMKRECTEEMEITAFDAPDSYEVTCNSHGCHYQTTFRFTDRNGGTRLEMVFQATPLTFVAKVMSVLMRPMMKMVVKECGKDLDDIKASAEAEVRAGAAGQTA